MEANVVYRISKGDERAMEVFMDTYSPALFHYAYGILSNRELAEEVVSDVFFEIWKGRKKILEIESMGAWLRTLTYRKSISALRHEQTLPSTVSIDDVENFTASKLENPEADDDDGQERIDQLNGAIESLPPKCRHVFYLAKIERVPYKEIAELLSISVATINYHVGYAMDFIKKRLGGPPG